MQAYRVSSRTSLSLLALGVVTYALGLWRHGLPWSQTPQASLDVFYLLLAATVLLPLLSLATGRVDPRRGLALAFAILGLAAGGLMEILGPLMVLAAGAVAATLLPQASLPATVRWVAGLGLVAALMGWLLPFPVHFQLTWIAALAVLIGWRRQPMMRFLRELFQEVQETSHTIGPAIWLFAPVVLVAIAPALMPRLSSDDLSYHLMIPRELLAHGYSRLDAATQAWLFAPWSIDLLHGLGWLLAGKEATTAGMNVFWLLAACALCARIGRDLGLAPVAAWLAAAIYASVPMVALLTGSFQVESASPAILAALFIAVSRAREPGALVVVAALAGFLIGSKTSNAMFLLPVAAWLLLRLRGSWPTRRNWVIAFAVGAFACGSSYFWGALLAGNPVLPLFNGVFGSPFFQPENWRDSNWQLDWGPGLPWVIVFETHRYLTASPGSMGAIWLVLAGALPLSLIDARTRPAALIGLAGLLLIFSQVQYLRYVVPPMILLVPALFAAIAHAAPRASAVAGVLLVLLQAVSIPTASWILKGGAMRTAILEGHDAVINQFAPERSLMEAFDAIAEPGDRVLFTDRRRAYVGILPGRSSSVSWYDYEISSIFRENGGYSGAKAWRRALASSGANYLVVSHDQAIDGLGALVHENVVETIARSSISTLYRLNIGQPLPIEATETGVAGTAKFDTTGPVVGSLQLNLRCDQPGKPIAIGWTVHSGQGDTMRHWSWLACGHDGLAQARVSVESTLPVMRVDVVAQPAPPSAGMRIQGLSGSVDLRRDLLASRSPVIRRASFFCPTWIPFCRQSWATLGTLP